MPTHVVLFTDSPDADPGLRARHMPAHLAFLDARSTRIRAAGPLHDPEGAGAGGMWMVEAHDAAEVEALIRQDPFWTTGLRGTHRVLMWTRVHADGHRLAGTR